MNKFHDHRYCLMPCQWPALIRSGVGLVLVFGMTSISRGDDVITLQYPESIVAKSEDLPTPLPATEEPAVLTLEELEQMALAANPSVRRMWALVGAARGNLVQVGLPPNPSVGYEGQQLGSGGLAEQHGVLFSQEFVRGGKLRLNRAVAERERMQVEQELAAQEQRVLTDVRIAYYEVVLAQRQILLTDNLIRISGEGSQSVDALFQAKEVGRVDILQAQLEIENARILAQNAQNRHDAAWRSLAAVVGTPELAPQPLEGDAEQPPREFGFEDSLARLLQLSPEISAAAIEVERACLALQRARAEPVPNVNFQGLVNWQDNGIGGKPDGGVAVSLPIPFFNRNQGAIARAEHEVVAAKQALSQLTLDLQNRLAPIFEQYSNARNQVERYNAIILPAAQESLDLTRQMYAAGEANYTALLTAQRTYSQTQINYLDAVRMLRIAEVEIEGLLLRGSLETTPIASTTRGSDESIYRNELIDFRGR
jgi:cobalt-zinc-cadmium efflux system outer membrane protein